MLCATCQDTRQKSGFTRVSKNYQASALSEHSKSRSHASAVTSLAKQPSMKGHSDAASAKENECLKAQLHTVLCMATQNIASNNFEALIELQKENGRPVYSPPLDSIACYQFITKVTCFF